MSQSLVTVITPCYNTASELPWALGSLLAQTYSKWECVVVDDGSEDDPGAVVAAVDDPRVRLVRHPENRGRAAARQTALEHTEGEYVAMLDADDWMYPQRLERQVEVLVQHPHLALVSAAVAISDGNGEMVGTRSGPPGEGALWITNVDKLRTKMCSFPASMVRADLLKEVGFDPAFRYAEDFDMLLRLLWQRYYGVLSEVLYAYAEIESMSLRKSRESYKFSRRAITKHARRSYLSFAAKYLELFLKEGVTWVAYKTKLDKKLIQRRSAPPATHHINAFREARERVAKEVHRIERAMAMSSVKR